MDLERISGKNNCKSIIDLSLDKIVTHTKAIVLCIIQNTLQSV